MLLSKKIWRVGMAAFWQFNADDGWAIASHIALSSLMAMFPFFLVLTALAGIIGSQYLADEAANLVLEAWPEEVSGPISREIHNVLVGAHGQVLTVGGQPLDVVIEIVRYEPPGYAESRFSTNGMDVVTTYALRDASGGTELTQALEGSANGFKARLLLPVVQPKLEA